jgi:hypothetical protein
MSLRLDRGCTQHQLKGFNQMATQLVLCNNVYTLKVDPAKTKVTIKWLVSNGFKFNYKTIGGCTNFTLRHCPEAAIARLAAKYPAWNLK